ncbi:MAG TPA: hypothetical protein VMR41_02775 [Patescibacteria group bacterium]|nr:hypothetical protein [Patescibacteria group bacterium]
MDLAKASAYSYFWRGEPGSGLLCVNRECERLQRDAMEIAVTQSPDFKHENIGVRTVISKK